MSGDEPTMYDIWDMTLPPIPGRSRLYHLAPVGVGTPYTESLTAYISRVAEAHSVRLSTLIVRELAPLLQSSRPSRLARLVQAQGEWSPFWWNEAPALNGTQTQAQDWVQALEKLTLRDDLRCLTFLPWTDVLDQNYLMHRTRAWCPACYGEWRATRQVVYDPLLWKVAVVTACLRHRRRLQIECAGCGHTLPTLARRVRSGYCPHCGRWLGVHPGRALRLDEQLDNAELVSQTRVVEAIGALIAAAPTLPAPPGRERVVQAITTLVNDVGAGKLAPLARRVSLPTYLVWRWHRGIAVPQLDSLLRLCFSLGTTPLDLLTGKGSLNDRNRLTPAPTKLVRTPRSRPRMSLAAERARSALMHVLLSHEFPPPCMREVARRLETTPPNLYQKAPDLCHEISARFQAYRKACRLEKEQQLCDQIRLVMFQLHDDGVYPSQNRVEALLPVKAALRLPVLKAEWRSYLQQLTGKSTASTEKPSTIHEDSTMFLRNTTED